MNSRRKKLLLTVILIVAGMGAATGLALMAFQENLLYFYSPTQVRSGEAPENRSFRIGGLVTEGSVVRGSDDLKVRFSLTDTIHTVPVEYEGILPDLFREGQGIVANGALGPNGVFTASEVLAKHDENYMPPEVAEALEKAGVRHDTGKPGAAAMIPELGHFALILALCVAVLQTILPITGAARGNVAWMAVARPAAQVQSALVALAFAALTWSFIANDFTVAYVANNSNSLLPLIYRISAVWGAHEGSLLLWALILSLWTVAVSLFSRHLPEAFVARVLGVLGLISIGFLLFMLLTSNPFDRLFPGPADGADLNPLLQDPGLIIHPPMLYMGYVGFSVAFGFAIAALLGGNLDVVWARWSRPWTIIAWSFLTVGIALGSWWAYYELGWGGWWFWDPVENASFMPWLMGTALIHSLAATEKRGVFKNWTILLAICAFSLSLLGTFLVRSGVITSVHAFASDPTRGVFILALLGVVIGGSLVLYALRVPKLHNGNSFAPVSRETLLLVNSVLLCVATAAVLLGTIYPLIVEALGMGKLSVGEPYFNAVFVPLMAPVAVAVGIGMIARWRADEWSRIRAHLAAAAGASLVLGLVLVAMLADDYSIRAALGAVLGLWILFAAVAAVRDRVRNAPGLRAGLSGLPAGYLGMCLAHAGFAIAILGVSITSQYSTEIHRRMGIGDTVEFSGYAVTLKALREVEGPNYSATEGVFGVYRETEPVAVLHSQKRFYPVAGASMTEAGIDGGLFRDLYISLGESLESGDWSVSFYHRPFVRWIWLGAIFMALGGILAAGDRRYRVRVEHKRAAIAPGTAAADAAAR